MATTEISKKADCRVVTESSWPLGALKRASFRGAVGRVLTEVYRGLRDTARQTWCSREELRVQPPAGGMLEGVPRSCRLVPNFPQLVTQRTSADQLHGIDSC